MSNLGLPVSDLSGIGCLPVPTTTTLLWVVTWFDAHFLWSEWMFWRDMNFEPFKPDLCFCVGKDRIFSYTLKHFFENSSTSFRSISCLQKQKYTSLKKNKPKTQPRKRGCVLNGALMAFLCQLYFHFSSQVCSNVIKSQTLCSVLSITDFAALFVMVLFNGTNCQVFSVGFYNDHPSTSLSRQLSLIDARCTSNWFTEHLFICDSWCCSLTAL